MKKKVSTILIVVFLLVIAVIGYFSFEYIRENKPNDEVISSEELFGVSGDEIAIMYNNSLQEIRGIYENEQIYLPLTWVQDYLNDKFYRDDSCRCIIYTLPDQICYYDTSSVGSSGKPLILADAGDIYLSAALVNAYTDITCTAFTDSGAKRVFIEDIWDSYTTAKISKQTVLRTGKSIKQRGITDLTEGAVVRILRDYETTPDSDTDSTDKPWCRILTGDGFTGYVAKNLLSDFETVTPVSTFNAPVYTHLHMAEPIVLAWHQVTNMTANGSLASALKDAAPVNVISPTWFSLTDNEGNMSSLVSDDYIAQAHEMGLQVWALVDNFSPDIDSETILKNSAARNNIITTLTETAVSHGIDGINVDFERLPESAGEAFVEFIRELSVSCRFYGLVLSIDNPNPAPYNLFYGREAQGECADYVVNMGYDEHYAGDEAGSVSSFPFFQNGIDFTLAEVPAESIIGGVPFYTRIWDESTGETTSQAVGLDAAAEWVKDNNVSLTWDDSLGQYVGFDGPKKIWLEDNASLEIKMNYIKETSLAGVACWKLGLNNTAVWDAIHW